MSSPSNPHVGSDTSEYFRLLGVESPNPLYEEIAAANVGIFLMVLSSKLTQYDKATYDREAKKGRGNPHRLGLLMQALNRVRAHVHGVESSDSPEALKDLKGAMTTEFDANLPPVKATIKQIDAYLATGKKPSLVK